MNKTQLFIIAIFILILSFGSQAQVFQDAMKIIDPGKGGLSEKDAIDGIKEALVKGTAATVALVSKTDGY